MANENPPKDKAAGIWGLVLALLAIAIIGAGAATEIFYPTAFSGGYYILGMIMANIASEKVSIYFKSWTES